MKLKFIGIPSSILVSVLTLGWIMNTPTLALAQDQDHTQHHPQDTKAQKKAAGPLAPLQKALEKSSLHPAPKKQSKMKKNQSPPQGAMKPSMNMNPTQGSGMGGGGMMEMMGQMMNQMAPSKMTAQPSSELPGFPGASHIYHIGATGFFVDHTDMVDFTTEQLTSLNRIKEKSLLTQSSFDRKIEQAEEDLWTLTASDRPDIKSIEAKVREIESLNADQRISFIRDVGEASSILNSEQRSVLLGKTPPKAPGQGVDPMKRPKDSMPQNNSSPGMSSMGDM